MKKYKSDIEQGNNGLPQTTDELFNIIIFNSDVRARTGLSNAYITRCRAKIKGVKDISLTNDKREEILLRYGAKVFQERKWTI